MTSPRPRKPREPWPPAEVGEDALESLLDGNPPEKLVAFAFDARAAGHPAHALPYLFRGLAHLNEVVARDAEAATSLAPAIQDLTNEAVRAAAALGDDEALRSTLPASPTPGDVAWRAHELLLARASGLAVAWFERARGMVTDPVARGEHLVRFGPQEVAARARAKRPDRGFAAELFDVATAARKALSPGDPAFAIRVIELDALIRAARRGLAAG